MKINCAWRIHFIWKSLEYNLSYTGCPFIWHRSQVGSHQARGGLCTRMTRGFLSYALSDGCDGWKNRAGFVGGDFQPLLRWTKIFEMLASKVWWWDSPVGSPDDLLRKSTPLKWLRIVAIKHECATLTGLFTGTWYKKEGAEGDCALQIPSSESPSPFS